MIGRRCGVRGAHGAAPGHHLSRSRWRNCSIHAYNTYRKSHPWVGDHPLSPKSVIRDMYERALSFTELVSHYELARTEGIVLRYLASAYKALEHTVPDDLKSEDLEDLIACWARRCARSTPACWTSGSSWPIRRR
ncbi:hypothetical protein GCM10023238_32310 [Streptomyces heliomycini]